MIKARRDLAFCCPVGAQLVRNDPFGTVAPAFYQFDQEPLCCALVSSGLKDFLKDHAVFVDRPRATANMTARRVSDLLLWLPSWMQEASDPLSM